MACVGAVATGCGQVPKQCGNGPENNGNTPAGGDTGGTHGTGGTGGTSGTGGLFPPGDRFITNATGPRDPLYESALNDLPALKNHYGADLTKAINIVEQAYMDNGMKGDQKEFVDHTKALHFLKEIMDDPAKIRAEQLANYGPRMAKAIDDVVALQKNGDLSV